MAVFKALGSRGWAVGWLLILWLGGCFRPSQPAAREGLWIRTLVVDGRQRRYALFLPQPLGEERLPLVLELHGGGIPIEEMLGLRGHKSPYKLWMDLAVREGFLVLYPEGWTAPSGRPTWNDCRRDCAVCSSADDVRFLETLIEEVASRYPVDRSRIYVSGTSNGGFMAQRLAGAWGERLAAVASVAAALPAQSECPPPRVPISVLYMNGTQDNHMPYQGGLLGNPPDPAHGTVRSTEDSVAFWVALDGTETTPRRYALPDLDANDGGTVEKWVYAHGLQDTEVVLYRINGGGHSAPSLQERYSRIYERYFNRQNHDVEMTSEVWAFFRRHRRPAGER